MDSDSSVNGLIITRKMAMFVFGDELHKYKMPTAMPEHKQAVQDLLNKRPMLNYRIFINNVDTFLPLELAKHFVKQKYHEKEIPPKPPSSSDSETSDTKSKGSSSKRGSVASRRASNRKKGKQRKSMARRQSARRASSKQKSSRRQSTRRGSSRRASARRASGRRASSKRPSGRRASSRRASGRRASSRRSSRRASSKRGSQRFGKQAQKGDRVKRLLQAQKSSGTQKKDMTSKYFQTLWPIHTMYKPMCTKKYDWFQDYAHLEEKRVTEAQIEGFDPERAKLKRDMNYVLPDDLKYKMKKKFWYYSRYMPSASPPKPPTPPRNSPEPERKYAVETIILNKIWDLMEQPMGLTAINFYRRDIMFADPYYEVYGTSVLSDTYKQNPKVEEFVKKIVSNPTDPQVFEKDVFSCTLIIYDITREDANCEEARDILDMLIQNLIDIGEDIRHKLQAFFGIHTFILISPLLTWNNSHVVSRFADQHLFREEYFPKRVPHPKYRKHYDLENYVHDKSYQYRDILRILVIGVGLVYGNGGVLESYVNIARENKTFFPVFGSGKNTISTIHTTDLARLILHLLNEWPDFSPYIVAGEKKESTQKSIVDLLSNCVGENYTRSIPRCFSRAFNITGFPLDVIASNCYVFPSYLIEASQFTFEHAFATDACPAVIHFIENGDSRPLRILLFGPYSIDQNKIGIALSKYYNILYINPFKAIQIFMKLMMRMQEISSTPLEHKISEDKYRLSLLKDKFERFNILRLLVWQREFRRFLLRNKAALPSNYFKSEKSNPLTSELNASNMKEYAEEAVPMDYSIGNSKGVLLKYEKILKDSNGHLTTARIDILSEIVFGIINHPVVKFSGYILDGIPSHEIEADIVFNRSGLVTAEEARGEEYRRYINIPKWIFHITKEDTVNLADTLTKQSKSFQKDYMEKFQRMHLYRGFFSKLKSAIDVLAIQSGKVPFTFDTAKPTVSEVVEGITQLVGDSSLYAGKWNIPRHFAQPTIPSDKLSVASDEQKSIEKEDEDFTMQILEEMSALADEVHHYGYYMNRFIYNIVIQGLISTVDNSNDEEPVDYFAEFLFKNNGEGRMPHDRIIKKISRENLETYPFDIPKTDLRFSTHL